MRRLRVFFAVVASMLGIWAVVPMPSFSTPTVGSVQKKIDSKKAAIGQKKQRERVLTGDIAGFTKRIDGVQTDIDGLEKRLGALQTDLDGKRAELASLQGKLRAEKARLARLKAELVRGRQILATRLVEIYKADAPDVVTVVLESHGFEDLLEREEFLSRIGKQDNRILTTVKSAKKEATATEKSLSGLESRQQKVTAAVLDRRDEVAVVRNQLVDKRDGIASLRSQKQGVLSNVRAQRGDLEGDLKDLVAQQAQIKAKLARAAAGISAAPDNFKAGSGQLSMPVSGPIVSPFGMRWGRLHAGIDIAVPTGTPVHASDGGKVVLMGWVSGYGNYTCVQHTSSLSTCYAHQSSFATSQGASVNKGDVIGYSGCTGHCFGPHVHFEVRINGAPVNPLGYL